MIEAFLVKINRANKKLLTISYLPYLILSISIGIFIFIILYNFVIEYIYVIIEK